MRVCAAAPGGRHQGGGARSDYGVENTNVIGLHDPASRFDRPEHALSATPAVRAAE